MSIIHDALKKVQQGLTPNTNETLANPPIAAEKTTGSIYDTPPEIEVLPPVGQAGHQKPSLKYNFKFILIPALALVIAAASVLYLYPKLIHKKKPVDFKNKPLEDLVPLAKITVNPPKPALPAASSTANADNAAKPSAPQTLNIHGVMSNGSNNLVLINDQVYQEGDEVDGIKIVKIDLSSITVINNGKEETINVK